ncbi:MAG: GntR family transcriptional regulator [Planctomycetota bacterium]
MSTALRQAVYDHLCKKLLEGSLRAGERISELTVAKETGVSRSPVREAIGQLRAEGILEQVPGYGAFVKSPSRRELTDAYEVREWLESQAVYAMAARPDLAESHLIGVRQVHNEMHAMLRESYLQDTRMLRADQIDAFARLDIRWHEELLDGSGNRQIRKIVRDTRLLVHAAGCKPRPLDPDHIAQVFAEHDLILRVITQRDAGEARRLMTEHIRWAARKAAEIFDAKYRPEPEPPAPERTTGIGPRFPVPGLPTPRPL